VSGGKGSVVVTSQDVEILYDAEYTAQINDRIRSRFPSGPRNATHASDCFYCLRKAWRKRQLPEGEREPDDELLLTFLGGLLFEDLVTEGEPQRTSAYCWTCQTVNRVLRADPNDPEPETCGVCGNRWLLFTPDYIADGVIHEVKQTRKSRRRGPADAPWWIDQLRTYFAFAQRAGWVTAPYARLVVNWMMGDYGSRRKGMKPVPPRAALDAFKIVFDPKSLEPWMEELHRRARIVEGEEVPPLTGMGEGEERSPAYEWECGSCDVGRAMECENYRWDAEGKERYGLDNLAAAQAYLTDANREDKEESDAVEAGATDKSPPGETVEG
jgi:hypothetical protein